MVYPEPSASEAAAAEVELIQLLAQAKAALARLRDRACSVAALAHPLSPGFCPDQLKTLCAIVDNGRARIDRRLAILKAAPSAGDDIPKDSNPPFDAADPMAFMSDYRGCCRILCKALNETLRIGNGPVGAMLSDLILRLEKQLWLMDPPRQHPGTDRYRSVSLFLTC